MSKLSIITINLNNADGLRKTIKSIFEQTYLDFEYIIIDGESTDGSVSIIKENESGINYWISEPDKGIFNAMNKGIRKASGEYLLFLNSGDYLEVDVLNVVDIDNFNDDIIYGNMNLQFSNRVELKRYPAEITLLHFVKSSLGHSSCFIKRSLFEHNLYREEYKIVSDWAFFIKAIIIDNCKTRYIDKVISNFDMTGISSLSADLAHIERDQVLKELFPRIYPDYFLISSLSHSKLLPLMLFINETRLLKAIVYRINLILVRTYKFCKF